MACKGVLFALELGLLSLKEKSRIRQRIEAAGGSIAAIVGASVRVLIITPAVQAAGSYKLNSAKELGIPIFLVDDLDEVLSFPPSPRQVSAPPSRGTSSRIGRSSTEKTPLISWDDPPVPSDPSSSLSSSDQTVEALNPSKPSEATDEFPFGSEFGLGLEFDYTAAAPSHTVASAPLASSHGNSVPATEDGSEGFAFFGFDFETDFSIEKSVSDVSTVLRPQHSAREPLDQKILGLSERFSPELLKSSTSGLSRASNPSQFGYTSVKETTITLSDKTALEGLKKRTSDAMTARAAKYLEITSKSAAPLVVAPIQLSQPTFTPLTFDLKPITIKPLIPRFGVSSRSSTSSDPSSLVFESLITHDKKAETENTSSNGSLRSSSSNLSSDRLSSHSLSENDEHRSLHSSMGDKEADDEGFELESPHIDDSVDDVEEDSLDNEDGGDEILLSHQAPVVATAPMKRQKVRRPRVYVDPRTGDMWQRKNIKLLQPHSKLVLESANGVNRVMKLNESAKIDLVAPSRLPVVHAAPSIATNSVAPSTIAPFSAASLDQFGPPLPSKAASPVVHKVITGKTNPKFAWVDIVTGKASTTKRVPAMDGFKLFVSGITFDDLKMLGQPREAQLPSYKAVHVKKVMEKNEKALRKLRKKSKKLALERATVTEEGKLVPADASTITVPKRRDGLERMKTDEQLLNEIVVWSQRQLDAAIALRQRLYRSIFSRFGEVANFIPEWERGFIHVTYKSATSARACMKALQDFDLRNACIRSLHENNLTTPFIKQALPSPSFYVRWTTCYQRKLNNKTKKVALQKQKDMDTAIAQHAARAAADISKIPSRN